jgi:hypothetical protein
MTALPSVSSSKRVRRSLSFSDEQWAVVLGLKGFGGFIRHVFSAWTEEVLPLFSTDVGQNGNGLQCLRCKLGRNRVIFGAHRWPN